MEVKNQKKILFIIGTRPEAIKICPVIKEAGKYFNVYTLCTGQHYDSVIEVFNLFGLTIHKIYPSKKFNGIHLQLSYYQKIITECLNIFKPNLVVVHGDTTSCYAGALSSFFLKQDIAHVEAGLRTQNIYAPFPEEMFRKWTDAVSRYCYAPTENAKTNLLQEGISSSNIFLTGNTIIDALLDIQSNAHLNELDLGLLDEINQMSKNKNGYFLVTLHRNEIRNNSLGKLAKTIIEKANRENYSIVWPLHPNKLINKIVLKETRAFSHVLTIPPVKYSLFIKIMRDASVIITDSGGIQEEATFLRKKVVILREETERKEVLLNKSAIISGIDPKNLNKNIDYVTGLSDDVHINGALFGNGDASTKIVSHWREIFS